MKYETSLCICTLQGREYFQIFISPLQQFCQYELHAFAQCRKHGCGLSKAYVWKSETIQMIIISHCNEALRMATGRDCQLFFLKSNKFMRCQ